MNARNELISFTGALRKSQFFSPEKGEDIFEFQALESIDIIKLIKINTDQDLNNEKFIYSPTFIIQMPEKIKEINENKINLITTENNENKTNVKTGVNIKKLESSPSIKEYKEQKENPIQITVNELANSKIKNNEEAEKINYSISKRKSSSQIQTIKNILDIVSKKYEKSSIKLEDYESMIVLMKDKSFLERSKIDPDLSKSILQITKLIKKVIENSEKDQNGNYILESNDNKEKMNFIKE